MSAPALGWLFYTLSFVSILTVVPAYIDPASRTFAVGVMPLAGIATSMIIRCHALAIISIINVILFGFALSAFCALLLWPFPGNP